MSHTYHSVEIGGNAQAVLGDKIETIYNLFLGDPENSQNSLESVLSALSNHKNTRLLEAAEQGNLSQVQSLLDQGANILHTGQDGHNVLHKAVISENVDIIHILLRNPATRKTLLNRPDARFLDTPLHRAASGGNAEVVKALLQYDPRLEARQIHACTPLLLTAVFGHAQSASLLIEKGADKFARNMDGSTSFHLAARNRHIEVFKTLVEASETSNWLELRNNFHDTPMFIATAFGNEECARIIWRLGADLTVMNFNSANLLHATVIGRLPALLTDLLPHFNPNEVNHKDKFGQTPLKMAENEGIILCKEILNHKSLEYKASCRDEE